MSDTKENVVALVEYAKGENGEVIKLGDVKKAKTLLTRLSKKYKDFKITPENWKKEGADAERELRQARYDLQNIQKNGNSLLAQAKKKYAETFDSLIGINRDKETEIKAAIDDFKKKDSDRKEEEKRKAHEELIRIEKLLSSKEQEFALLFANAKTEEDLENYQSKMSEFNKDIESFGKLDYKAEYLYSELLISFDDLTIKVNEEIEKAKESDRLRIENERLEKESKEREEQEKERVKLEEEEKEKNRIEADERATKILAIRITKLETFGLEKNENQTMSYHDEEYINLTDVMSMDELQWMEFSESIPSKLKELDNAAENYREAAQKIINDDYKDLVQEFKKLGGTTKEISRKKVVSIEMVTDLQAKTKELHQKAKKDHAESVKKELDSIRGKVAESVGALEKMVRETKFTHPESRDIVNALIKRFENAVNETFD